MTEHSLWSGNSNEQKNEVINYIKDVCLSRGDFTLSSGKKSDSYVDVRRLISYGPTLSTLTSGIISVAHEMDVELIGGRGVGPHALVGACVVSAYDWSMIEPRVGEDFDLYGFWLRNEIKNHGTGSIIEGSTFEETQGKRAIIVEDVTTTGMSAAQAALDAWKHGGMHVVAIITVFDRQEGAKEAIEERRYKFLPFITMEDLDE